jgi:hypothetical protein
MTRMPGLLETIEAGYRILPPNRPHAATYRLIAYRFSQEKPDAYNPLNASLVEHVQDIAARWYPDEYKHPARYFKNPRQPFAPELNQLRGGVRFLHPAFLYYVNDQWFRPLHRHEMDWPSTGFKSLIIALDMCDRVDAYGFGGTNERGRWEHYNGRPAMMTGGHLPNYQNEFLDDLAERRVISLNRGSQINKFGDNRPPRKE